MGKYPLLPSAKVKKTEQVAAVGVDQVAAVAGDQVGAVAGDK